MVQNKEIHKILEGNRIVVEKETKIEEGWGKSPVSRKWHYFRNHTSLCGKIGFYFGPVEQGSDNSPNNCAKCCKELAKEKGELK